MIRSTIIGFVIFCYCLVFGEIFVRIFAPQPLIPRYVMDGGYGIRVNVPNSEYRHITEEVDVRMVINSVGMRSDKEYPQEKPIGLCRVGVFGDSFFMGYEVNLQESFAFKLEEYLNGAGFSCEVLNFSVSGFGTAESIIQYQHFARNYDLDVAVLEWHHTDPNDNLRSGLFKVEEGELKRAAQSFLPGVALREALMRFSLYRWLIQNSHLYTAGREKAALLVKDLVVRLKKLKDLSIFNKPESPLVNVDEPDTLEAKPDVEYTLDSLLVQEFARNAAADGVVTVVLDVPSALFSGSLKSSFDYLAGDFQRELHFCSPISVLAKLNSAGHKLFFEKGHKHFTPIGYDALAQTATDCIKEIKKSIEN